LLGFLATELGDEYENLSELELVFPQTTFSWKKNHGGPKEIICYEYSVPLLLESILTLVERGVSVSVSLPETENP